MMKTNIKQNFCENKTIVNSFNKTILSLVLMIIGCMVSCDNQLEEVNIPGEQLQVKAVVGEADSRAIIEGESFPDKSEIGLTLEGYSFSNIKFTATGTGASQSWAGASAMLLSETKGTLYGYHPYSSTATNLTALPLATSGQTDYMYANSVANISENNSVATLKFNHAMACIRVTIKKGTYAAGNGAITAVSVKSEGFGTTGTLNAKTGAVTATGTNTAVSQTVSKTLGATVDALVVPASVEKAITFSVTVDGTTYTATSKAVKVDKNNIYTYTVTLNSTFMEVSGVSIGKWTTTPKDTDLILNK